jgi:hypothetical protein
MSRRWTFGGNFANRNSQQKTWYWGINKKLNSAEFSTEDNVIILTSPFYCQFGKNIKYVSATFKFKYNSVYFSILSIFILINLLKL